MKLKCTSDNRELILQVLRQETGADPVYLGLPEFSYTVGQFRLLRSGYIEYDASDMSGLDSNANEENSPKSNCTFRHDLQPHAIAALVALGLCDPPCGSIKNGAPIHGVPSLSHVPEHGSCSSNHAPIQAEHSLSVQPRPPEHGSPIPSYPLKDHTGRSLLNLFCIFSARQNLLNRALDAQGAFFVSRSLMGDLLAHPPEAVSDFIRTIYDREDEYRGFRFAEGQIFLTGFRKGWPGEEQIYRQLADLIIQAALDRRWIKPFTRNIRNKKYYFRIWLNTLGMIGPEYETARQVLLSRLPGRSDRRKIPRGKPAFGREQNEEV